MSSKGHNKKRNSGLLYEFLVRTISSSLVEEDGKRSAVALKILRRHYKPGTELYREFRLINSLVKTSVSSEAVAGSILQEAKAAARSYDATKLDREKSLLIRSVNHQLKDDNFYDQQVNEYRIYATIQSLINSWRSADKDIEKMAMYEQQLVSWLTSPRTPISDPSIVSETPGTNRLLMKIIVKRLNEKYAKSLTPEQRSIVKSYAFSAASDDSQTIRLKLAETRDRLVDQIDAFRVLNPNEEYVNKKMEETKRILVSENFDVINDDLVTRFMLYTQLSTELASEDDK